MDWRDKVADYVRKRVFRYTVKYAKHTMTQQKRQHQLANQAKRSSPPREFTRIVVGMPSTKAL